MVKFIGFEICKIHSKSAKSRELQLHDLVDNDAQRTGDHHFQEITGDRLLYKMQPASCTARKKMND
jgi:hypothetical protein